MLTQLIKSAKSAISSAVGEGKKTDLQSRVEEFGTSHWNDLKSAYITYHQTVWDSFLKYAGVLWIQWNANQKVFEVSSAEDEWTPMPEVNRFSPTIDAMISNFSTVPEIEAVPNRLTDPEAFAISDVATRLAQHIIKTCSLHKDFKGDEDKPGRAGALLTLTGTVFTHVFPTSEEIGSKPVTAVGPAFGVSCPTCKTYQTIPAATVPDPSALAVCPQCQGPTQVEQTQAPIDTGKVEPIMQHGVRVEIGNPIFALPRPGARFMGESGYFFWAQRMNVNEVWQMFDIEAQPDAIYLDGYSVTGDHALQYYYTGSSSSTLRTKEECMVVQLFIEPGKVKDVPEGAYGIMIGQEWVHVEPWPFVEHPVTKANYKNMPTMFFGRTDATDLAKLQKETNHYEALIKLHAMTSSQDPILQDENTQVDEITNRGDRVIKYRSLGPGSQPPSRLQHGTLDNGVYVQRDKLQAEFQNTSGAVNVWKGEAPGSITAASAISQLRGQAEQMFGTPLGNWQALWSETIRKGVKILQATMEPWEIAAIIGDDRDTDIDMFKRADLDQTMEWVSTRAGLPRTRDERRQELMMLWDKQALDMSDVNVKQEIADLFGETGMMQQFNKDATRARMENQQVKEGTLQNLQPMIGIEDLSTHYEIHIEQIKSLDFDKWPSPAKQLLIEHALATKDALMMEQGLIPPAENGAPGDSPEAGPAGTTGGPAGSGGGAGNANGATKGGKNGSRGAAGTRKASPVPSTNNGKPQVPTGPNGPGSGTIPGGNR
jgi:hypothetical protein